MKVFSFFSGKGGVGKTTLTILFASFLSYYLDLNILVMDGEKPDGRIMPFRKLDLDLLNTPGSSLSWYAASNPMPTPSHYYEIQEYGLAVGEYTSDNVLQYIDTITNIKTKAPHDVLLIDFPARYADNMPVRILAQKGVLDGAYVPTRLEQQERRSACIAAMGLASCGVPVKIMWNDVDADIVKRGTLLDQAEEETAFLKKYGVSYSPTRIKHFRKASRSSEDRCFVRSTVCWPEKYVRLWCPELLTLFAEISSALKLTKR